MNRNTIHIQITSENQSHDIESIAECDGVILKMIQIAFVDSSNTVKILDLDIPWLKHSHKDRSHLYPILLPYQPQSRIYTINPDLEFNVDGSYIPASFVTKTFEDGTLASASYTSIDLFFETI